MAGHPAAPAVGMGLKNSRIVRVGIVSLACMAWPAMPLAAPADLVALPSSNAAPVDPAIPVVLLIDLSSGQTLFSREPDRRFVPASVTKVMTAYTAFGLIAEGKLSLDQPVTISPEVAEMWSGEGSSM